MTTKSSGDGYVIAEDVSISIKNLHEIVFKKGYVIPDYYRFYDEKRDLYGSLQRVLSASLNRKSDAELLTKALELELIKPKRPTAKSLHFKTAVIGDILASVIKGVADANRFGNNILIKRKGKKLSAILSALERSRFDLVVFAPDIYVDAESKQSIGSYLQRE